MDHGSVRGRRAGSMTDRRVPRRLPTSATSLYERATVSERTSERLSEKFRTSQKGIERSSGEFGLAEFAKIESEQAQKVTRVPR